MDEIVIPCEDLNEAVDFFTTRLGFRLDMIFPADDPTVAVISGHGKAIRLERPAPITTEYADDQHSPAETATVTNIGTTYEPPPGLNSQWTAAEVGGISDAAVEAVGNVVRFRPDPIISLADDANWVTGRAGMEYRDLVPGRLGGRLAASLINLSAGGVVPDYVHYHRVGFQLIYCWYGRVRVVYEDQGEPFWLNAGDCVLQPPEIRHRVLECIRGTQVIELSSPAIHETWADHEMSLPTGQILPGKDFSGQRFMHHRAADSIPALDKFGDFAVHDLGIEAGTNGKARAVELHSSGARSSFTGDPLNPRYSFIFVLTGRANVASGKRGGSILGPGDSIILPPALEYSLKASANTEMLCVMI